MPLPTDPRPISDSLRRHLDETLALIPSGKSGALTSAVTTQGFQLGIGQRWAHGSIGGWAGREWGGGWLAGASGTVMW